MPILQKAIHKIRGLSKRDQIIVGGIFAAVLLLGLQAASRSSTTPAALNEARHVSIASVASLSDKTGPLPVVGKVSSVSKASILAVSSGEIVSLSRSLGDRVAAGSVIASFENSAQRAAVLQAQGAYEGAQAALAKASGSTATNSGVTSAQAAQAAENAALAANAALKSAYASLDDAVHTKADAVFSNPNSNLPQLNVRVANAQLATDAINQRVGLNALLQSINALTDGDANEVDANLTTVIGHAKVIEFFLGNLVAALNQAITSESVSASTIATYQASIGTARTQTLAAISSLTSAKSTFNAAVSGATVAQNSASGGTANDIAAAAANVKSALGTLNAAQSNLEKTIIRAPISGTIVSLALTRGGYVSAFSQVAQISNPGALAIETYVTSEDAKTLTAGGKATIEGSIKGVVVFIAPALDPTTGKIQVKIGIPGDQSALTDGDAVTVSLERSAIGGTNKPAKSAITIPIAAAKITPLGPVTFTVSSSTLVANPVTFGPIVGGQVTILSGLTPEMVIVTDARGLTEGQIVVVDPSN